MKNTSVLVVYYSRAGKTKILAEEIAKKLNADVDVVEDLTKRTGPIHFMSSGRDAMKMRPTEIKTRGKDPSAYDLVLIGTPVYSGRVSAAIRAYATINRAKLGNVAFFLTHMMKENRAFEDLIEITGREPIATLQMHCRPDLRKGVYQQKLDGFVGRIERRMLEHEPVVQTLAATGQGSRSTTQVAT